MLPGVCTSGLSLGARYMVGPSFLQLCILALPSHVPRSQHGPARRRLSPASLLCPPLLPSPSVERKGEGDRHGGPRFDSDPSFLWPYRSEDPPPRFGAAPTRSECGEAQRGPGPSQRGTASVDGLAAAALTQQASQRKKDPSQSDVYGVNTCQQ